jgi:hypothetical protein
MPVLKEAFIPALTCLYGLVYFMTIQELPRESTVFPYFLMILMPFLGIMILIGVYRKSRKAEEKPAAQGPSLFQFIVSLKNPAIIYGLSIAYLVVFIFTNFLISTAIYLTGTMIIMREPWLKALIIGVGFSVALWVVFGQIFMVPI